VTPGQVVSPEAVQALAEMDIDASAAFPKPITDDAVHGADLVILPADLTEPAALTEPADAVPGRGHVVRWQVPDLDDAAYAEMQAGRDALDRRLSGHFRDLWIRIHAIECRPLVQAPKRCAVSINLPGATGARQVRSGRVVRGRRLRQRMRKGNR
jgi:hypothetical protein